VAGARPDIPTMLVRLLLVSIEALFFFSTGCRPEQIDFDLLARGVEVPSRYFYADGKHPSY